MEVGKYVSAKSGQGSFSNNRVVVSETLRCCCDNFEAVGFEVVGMESDEFRERKKGVFAGFFAVVAALAEYLLHFFLLGGLL